MDLNKAIDLPFGATLPIIDNGLPPYDTIDGQRFLVRAVPQQASPLTFIVNWPVLLKKVRCL
jgi:hypothetical protein